ncbi:hypothetical protein X777_11929 [Ooceraea biroi]|uniref:Uncharacterized protein n=1 Tax=Ooceraea biroi TaxID=2015173 RepID=A0A026W1H1_OOCBI|nr:hypothetical protein X777_11929 [Ooceraea biroi]
MFAPTRTCMRLLAYVYLVTHKRAVPRREGPFRRRRPSAPKIHWRYFIPEDFYEPIYHTSTGGPTGLAALCAPRGPKESGRAAVPSVLFADMNRNEGPSGTKFNFLTMTSAHPSIPLGIGTARHSFVEEPPRTHTRIACVRRYKTLGILYAIVSC